MHKDMGECFSCRDVTLSTNLGPDGNKATARVALKTDGGGAKTNDPKAAPKDEPRLKGDEPYGYSLLRMRSDINGLMGFADRGVGDPGFGMGGIFRCPKRGECVVSPSMLVRAQSLCSFASQRWQGYCKVLDFFFVST